ncbi:S1 RNA-binding domain-containing protein [Streptomyces sp. NPDC001634]|uniref:S1 RNA-binding domain-containing protein n=1 Tax=Streptomyces sp. NPDC001634 TaxID=3154390 RepID=UPI003333C39D
MSLTGTDAYSSAGPLPPLVERAVTAARRHGFADSCRPEQGRLLQTLAGGAPGLIGETGTGCGVGLAWLASGARKGVRLVSVERDAERARIAAGVFADRPEVEILHGDWRRIEERGPYDLLVLDGGGQGKTPGDRAANVVRLLAPGGTVVVDDFTPATTWPPLHDDAMDTARMRWLNHPYLHTTELRLADDLSTLVGTRRPPAAEPLHALKRGQVCRGVVTATPPFGVFVDLDGMEGFIRIPEITWRHIDSVEEAVRVGQEVVVEVLGVDAEREQAQVSLKSLEPSPLAAFAREGLGRVVRGRVTKVLPFGVVVRVADGIHGLVHQDELHGASPSVGDEPDVEVVGINLVRGTVSLALV